jgi:hypothetical protein
MALHACGPVCSRQVIHSQATGRAPVSTKVVIPKLALPHAPPPKPAKPPAPNARAPFAALLRRRPPADPHTQTHAQTQTHSPAQTHPHPHAHSPPQTHAQPQTHSPAQTHARPRPHDAPPDPPPDIVPPPAFAPPALPIAPPPSPPTTAHSPAAQTTQTLAPEVLEQAAFWGDGSKGVARLRFGKNARGVLSGSSVTLEHDGESLRIVGDPDAVELLRERLAKKGIVVDDA